MAVIQGGVPIYGSEARVFSVSLGSPALGTTTAVHAAVTDNAALQTVTTAITNPDSARNLTATSGGTGANITAVSVIVTGTDPAGNVQTETLPAFTAATPGTVTGLKAFRTVTSIAIPANGTGVTTAVGTGSKLGLGARLNRNSVIAAYLNGVKETTAPTVALNASVNANNTVVLNSALAGTPVIVDYIN